MRADPAAEWHDSYNLGVAEIDHQHQEFFKKYHDFCTAIAAGAGRSAIGEILGTLQSYANFHFASEESLMAQIGFTGLGGHMAQHQHFKETLALLIRDFYAGIDILDGVYLFFNHWLVQHIQNSDQRIGEFMAQLALHQIGAGAGYGPLAARV